MRGAGSAFVFWLKWDASCLGLDLCQFFCRSGVCSIRVGEVCFRLPTVYCPHRIRRAKQHASHAVHYHLFDAKSFNALAILSSLSACPSENLDNILSLSAVGILNVSH